MKASPLKFFISAMLALGCLAVSAPSASPPPDEAEFQVWAFKNQLAAWNGSGPLPHGDWPVRDEAMRLPVTGKVPPTITKNELILPAEKVNVIQIRADGGTASKCQLWFTTGVSPQQNQEKMVEFDLQPGAGVQDYTVDFKSVTTWKDKVASLRATFQGVHR